MRTANTCLNQRIHQPCKTAGFIVTTLLLVTGCSSDGESLFSGLNENVLNGPSESHNLANNSDQNVEALPSSPSAALPETSQPPQMPEPVEDNTEVVESTPTTDLNVPCDSATMKSAMLTLTNNARSQARNCGGRLLSAANALTWDPQLEAAATIHNNDMVDNNFFSHTGSNGLSVSDRVDAQGFSWRAVGENIAAGQRSTQSAMDDWLDSAGHCQNIMNAGYDRMAVACRVDPQSDYGIYWTAVYAR